MAFGFGAASTPHLMAPGAAYAMAAGADAIHLASAAALARAFVDTGEPVEFVCADRQLSAAAIAEGFIVS